ncbi:M56 family metallopeptidase [Undibacterium sp.]|jgi:bla regulator protein BlaR1|uniref:M56 family metallopeptidase n=1 Tax=Undibacterium sp. TaxID=1914977 RepID=UPI002CA304A2|nr:M56 family metallopeptidase [Undibacterium sp.]HTD04917.1 M56 family metallopeptidase [Undibacterium sp.]
MIDLVSSLVNAIGWSLIHFLWQGTVISCVTAFLLILLRNARPQVRYALSCSALLVCLILPVLEAAYRLSAKGIDSGQLPLAETYFIVELRSADWLLLTDWAQSNLQWIVFSWLCCVSLLILRMAMGLIWIRGYADITRTHKDEHWEDRLSHLARKFGIKREVRLRVVHDLRSPVTMGCWRSLVLIPSSLVSGMPADLLEALLAHELAHIHRFDFLINLMQSCIETLLFYHPGVWWISKHIRIEREQIADDLAARILGEPRRLALALQELDIIQLSIPQLAQAAHGGNLMTRIKRLLRPEVKPINWKALISVVGLAVACLGTYAHAHTPPVPVAGSGPDAEVTSDPYFDFMKCIPEWPRESLAKDQTGTVIISVLVENDGTIKDVKLDESSGVLLLDESVKSALLACTAKGVPGKKNGKAVQAWTKVKFVWKLN